MESDTLIQERVCVCHLYTITHAEPERVKNPCAKHGHRSTAMMDKQLLIVTHQTQSEGG